MQPGRLQPPRTPRPAPWGRWSRFAESLGPLGRGAVLAAALWLAVPAGAVPWEFGAWAPTARATEAYAQAEVIVHGQTVRVDVADTPEKQALGLGGRKRLGPLEGMLFVYAERRRPAFWMHGMVIPIDMIWLDNRRVVHIEADVPPPAPGTGPADLPTYAPPAPANFVLELAAGRAKALGLRVGDQVRYRFDVR
jgi:hypothetical protein